MSKLLLLCEGAYVVSPPEQPVPTFEVSEEHKEVVVISGEVRCLNSREKLTAPCIVPRNVRCAASPVASSVVHFGGRFRCGVFFWRPGSE